MSQNPNSLPVPEPREVIGLTASFSGIAALLVLATLAPNPGQSVANPATGSNPIVAEAHRAVGV